MNHPQAARRDRRLGSDDRVFCVKPLRRANHDTSPGPRALVLSFLFQPLLLQMVERVPPFAPTPPSMLNQRPPPVLPLEAPIPATHGAKDLLTKVALCSPPLVGPPLLQRAKLFSIIVQPKVTNDLSDSSRQLARENDPSRRPERTKGAEIEQLGSRTAICRWSIICLD